MKSYTLFKIKDFTAKFANRYLKNRYIVSNSYKVRMSHGFSLVVRVFLFIDHISIITFRMTLDMYLRQRCAEKIPCNFQQNY